MAQLRQTDYLPTRFDGSTLDRDRCRSHFLTFEDYLVAHELDDPADAEEVHNVVQIFKRTLTGKARLWIEGKVFPNVAALRNAFLARFSPSQTEFAHSKAFDNIQYKDGDSAEEHLSKIQDIADRIGYGEAQIRHRFLHSLPPKCRDAVIMSAPVGANAQQLAEIAQRSLELKTLDPQKEVTFSTQVNSLNDDLAAMREELNSLRLGNQDNTEKPVSKYSAENRHERGRKRTIFCDYCLKPGHKWRECRFRKERLNKRKNNRSSSRDRHDNRNRNLDRHGPRYDTRSGSRSLSRSGRRDYGQRPNNYRHADNRTDFH